jgi:NADH-quinone oxidoreductase subunit M
MNELSFPWISAALAFVFGTAVLLARQHQPDQGRLVAIATAAAATVFGLVAASFTYGSGAGERWVEPYGLSLVGAARPLFALDALDAALLPFSAFVVLMVMLGTPRQQLTPRRAAAALGQLAATWALMTTLDLSVMALAWMLGLLPLMPSRSAAAHREGLPLHAIYLIASTVLLVGALGLVALGEHHMGTAAPLSLIDIKANAAEGAYSWAAMPLLMLAIMIRKGVFPFHSWIPALSQERGPIALALVNVPQLGALVLVRVAIPVFPSSIAAALQVLSGVALFASVYGALLGLAARDLRRAYGWLTVSQSALVMVGLECTSVEGITGGLTLWISVGLALTGLALAIAAVEARVGQRSLDTLGGLGSATPWLAAAFILLGMSVVALPGTLGFIAEDLLVRGVLESYPGIGIAIVLATAVNGFTVMRAALRTFHGPPPPRRLVSDVLGRERLALTALVVALIGLGLWPRIVVSTRAPVAKALAARLAPTAP